MKRLWIRAHALPEVVALARTGYETMTSEEVVGDVQRLMAATLADENDMVVVEVSDHLVGVFPPTSYLAACGKVLADGEEPPYVGSDAREGKE